MSSDEDLRDMVGGCNVCCDEKGWEENPLVYCDGQGCNVAVHQACYGIVQVPSGPWYCRKCESQERSTRVRCDLCPSRDGALKRTDQNGWAHVVCALYIPEVRFGNVTTMEPILISLIPAERFGRSCYVCENANRGSKATTGACMQCNKPGCKQNFHVTCGQLQGLLCEEAGNMDNVKYCGYCQHHYAKLVRKAGRNVKIIPPFRPVPSRSTGIADSPGSSPDKSGRISPEESKLLISSNVLSRNNGGPGGGDYIPAKKIGSSNSINADIDSSTNSKNSSSSKSSKKNGSSHLSSKSSDSSISSKSSSSSITPKIAQPVLAVATFSHHHHHHQKNNKDEKPLIIDSKNRLGKDTEAIKDDSFTVKFGVDNPLMKGASVLPKKDFSTLQLKEVITDHPVSSSSKYDQGNNSSGVDSSSNAVVSTSGNSSSRHSQHGDKTTTLLPDIKPHVTLTPIPMHMQGGGGSTANTSASSSSGRTTEEREEKLAKDSIQNKNIKSPASSNNTISFHSTSFGHKMTEPTGAETNNKRLSDTTHLDLSDKLEKSGPPSKRSRGTSRDEDRGRKTPTKGRGGGRSRGASNSSSSYHNRRDNYDENSREDIVLDIGNSGSTTTRGSRSGRKPGGGGGSRLVGRPPADDPPAPTLSQLKSQMDAAAAASSDGSLGVLPTHMFGNALNPASSMAQRMVDTLSQEMEAVVAAGVSVQDTVAPPPPLVGISLPGKSASSNGPVSGTPSSINAASSSANVPPQTLEQLLERQWEQGSQFLMEQAQHLDIAQLLSCLNQLKQDNKALEEHVQTLAQRRDQLVAINARLSIPLGNSSGLGPLSAMNGSSSAQAVQNGHGTPPLQNHSISSGPKGLQVNSSTPSPQQHEIVVQSGRQHSHRDERMYHSEMTVSRTEINISHPPVGSPHGLSRQNVAPYGYPGPNHSAAGHHHPSQHGHGRADGSSR